MTFAIRRLFILLSASGEGVSLSLIGAILLLVNGHPTSGGCSHEDVGVGFLQFAEHFLPMFSLQKTAREQFY